MKAFGLAELPQLALPISRGMGLLWLLAGLLLLVAAVAFMVFPRWWWIVGLAALVLSQVVITSVWDDAKFGTLANVIVLVGVVYGFASQGPLSFRSAYERAVADRLQAHATAPLLTESDLSRLPAPVQRYVRLSGAVGQPMVHDVRAVWRGRIRAAPDAPWMLFSGIQHNFVSEPARFFLMEATRAGLPVDVYHAFRNESATMQVRLLSMVPLANASGNDLTRAETVTLFNDLCLLAPAALADPAIRWEPIDAHAVRGYYTVGAHTVSAVLSFNDAGELVDFVSDDRLAASPDGSQFTSLRWSTPVGDYRDFGPRRAFSRGEGRWHPPEGEFVYVELELLDLQTNLTP
jgi:hypothetical protein